MTLVGKLHSVGHVLVLSAQKIENNERFEYCISTIRHNIFTISKGSNITLSNLETVTKFLFCIFGLD